MVAGEGARAGDAADKVAAPVAAYLVPFGEIQQQVVLSVPGPMRVVVYRRLMLRIAERIARQRHCQALVTGDVVGQVASQTLENLAVVGSVATLPLRWPLIGMDKDEIGGGAARHLSNLDHPRPGLLHAVHAAQPHDPREVARGECSRAESAPGGAGGAVVGEAAVEDFEFPESA